MQIYDWTVFQPYRFSQFKVISIVSEFVYSPKTESLWNPLYHFASYFEIVSECFEMLRKLIETSISLAYRDLVNMGLKIVRCAEYPWVSEQFERGFALLGLC